MNRIDKRTKNQEDILNAIDEWLTTHTYAPSFRELSKVTGMSLGTVYNVCRELRDLSKIEYLDGAARTIRMV